MNEKVNIKELDGLSRNEAEAVERLKNVLCSHWPGTRVVLYGSKAAGGGDEESDIDVLVLLPCPVSAQVRKDVIAAAFEINLQYQSNISVMPVSKDEWDDSVLSVLPLHDEIGKTGVTV